MAFIPEDGTGLANANSFATVDEADTYFADRGNLTWESLDLEPKQQALVKATDHIEMKFGNRLKGNIEFTIQALSFPRIKLVDREGNLVLGVPVVVKQATFEYAVRAALGPLAPDPTVDASGLKLRRKRFRVGQIDTDKTFSRSASASSLKPYPAVDRLLRELTFPGGRALRA